MTLRFLRIPAASVFCIALAASSTLAQSRRAAPASPYGGTVVEDIIARVNDQIITNSDYQRALKELDQEGRQRGATMQEMSDARRDLLRNLIDQQLWLSKGKELNITGETELVNRLNDIRKQYHLATLEDLEKAAQEQGVSYEDFKANIRNQIITQDVMRQEVGSKINITPGEAERYYEVHKQDYVRPESVHLDEILISTGKASANGGADDPKKVAEAEAKANDIEAKLKAGGDFSELARTFSDGPTASQGGDLGTYRRGELASILEQKTFSLQAGQYTEPIRTKQGFIILKVVQHTAGGVAPFKDVEQDVEQNYYMSKMEPALRAYLTQMREESYIDIRPGYSDTGASPRETKPVYSAYTPPAPKKRHHAQRTRFRETGRTFRQKTREAEAAQVSAAAEAKQKKKHDKQTEVASQKPGKKEKIRFGRAPEETLPTAAGPTQTEDAGAVTQDAQNAEQEPINPLEYSPAPLKKTRFSDRARVEKQQKKKDKTPAKDALAPEPPTAQEVADRQTQSAPLGLAGDTSKKKKKKATTVGEKTRLSDQKRKENQEKNQTPPPEPTPIAPVSGAPAPATAPK